MKLNLQSKFIFFLFLSGILMYGQAFEPSLENAESVTFEITASVNVTGSYTYKDEIEGDDDNKPNPNNEESAGKEPLFQPSLGVGVTGGDRIRSNDFGLSDEDEVFGFQDINGLLRLDSGNVFFAWDNVSTDDGTAGNGFIAESHNWEVVNSPLNDPYFEKATSSFSSTPAVHNLTFDGKYRYGFNGSRPQITNTNGDGHRELPISSRGDFGDVDDFGLPTDTWTEEGSRSVEDAPTGGRLDILRDVAGNREIQRNVAWIRFDSNISAGETVEVRLRPRLSQVDQIWWVISEDHDISNWVDPTNASITPADDDFGTNRLLGDSSSVDFPIGDASFQLGVNNPWVRAGNSKIQGYTAEVTVGECGNAFVMGHRDPWVGYRKYEIEYRQGSGTWQSIPAEDFNSTNPFLLCVPEADLSIEKTVSPEVVNVGDEVTFTLTAANNGPDDAPGVVVTDMLPSGYTFVSANPSEGTYDSGTGIWTIGDLADGDSETLEITVTVLAIGDYTNTATISGDNSDPNLDNNSDDATVTPLNTTNAVNDINQTPKGVPVEGNVLTNDFDLEGDDQTVTEATYLDSNGDQVALTVGTPTTIYGVDDDGSVVVAGEITLNADGSYDFDPDPDFTGTVPLTYAIEDDNGSPATDDATLTIKVTENTPGENNPPLAQDDTAITQEGEPVTGNVLDNDSDPDGDPIEITEILADTNADGTPDNAVTSGSPTTIYGTDQNGDTVVAGQITIDEDTGEWTFDPALGFTGDVPLGYTIEDPDGLSDSSTLEITVVPNTGNQTFANDDVNLGQQGETLTGNILDNDFDPEGDDQTITQIDTNGDGTPDTAPTAGTLITITQDGDTIGELTVDPNSGAYIWVPEPDFVGTAVFAYEVCDDGTPQACATATLYLTNFERLLNIELTIGSCWRTLTSPVAGDSYADFFARFRTDGEDYGGLWTQGATGARTTSGGPNVFTLDGSGSNWVPVDDLSEEIPEGTGFLITVFDLDEFGNPSSGGWDKVATIPADAPERAAPITVTLGSVAGTTDEGGIDGDGSTGYQGFSMLGNPYKSPISFTGLTLNEVQQVAWVYNRNTGNWISTNGGSGDIVDNIIATGQGFVVQNVESPTGTPSVEFPETVKTTGGEFVGKQVERPDHVRLEIEGEDLYSSMWLEFAEYGSTSKTTGDVIQMMSFEQDYAVLSSMKEGDLYDIGRFPSALEELYIPIMAEVTLAGRYTIRATDLQLPAGAELYLHDLQTNTRVAITEDMEYSFRINQTAKRVENSCFTAPQKANVSVDSRFMITTAVGIDSPPIIPSEIRLSQNYPNPFNPTTQIRYELPRQSDVRLEVFDMTGRQVAVLVNGNVSAGTHTVNFDATNLSSGVYMYRLQAGNVLLSRKLTVIK